MSAIVTGVLGAGYIVGLSLYVVSTFLRAGRVLDPVLAPAGMVSKSYLVFGRQYQGVLAGREVEIYFVPSSGIRPAQLNVYVAADIGTRVAMGRQRSLLGCEYCERLEAAGVDVFASPVTPTAVGYGRLKPPVPRGGPALPRKATSGAARGRGAILVKEYASLHFNESPCKMLG